VRSVSEYSTIRYKCRPHVRLEVPIAVTRQIICVFCDAVLHNLEGIYQHFGRTCLLHIQWENDTENENSRIFRKSICFYQTTRNHILESCIVFLLYGNKWRYLRSFASQCLSLKCKSFSGNLFMYNIQYLLYARQKSTDHVDYNAGCQKHDATFSL